MKITITLRIDTNINKLKNIISSIEENNPVGITKLNIIVENVTLTRLYRNMRDLENLFSAIFNNKIHHIKFTIVNKYNKNEKYTEIIKHVMFVADSIQDKLYLDGLRIINPVAFYKLYINDTLVITANENTPMSNSVYYQFFYSDIPLFNMENASIIFDKSKKSIYFNNVNNTEAANFILSHTLK